MLGFARRSAIARVAAAFLLAACPAEEPNGDVGVEPAPDAPTLEDAPPHDAPSADVPSLDARDAPPSDTAASPDACPAPTSLCGAACVDTSADPDHCGACESPCVPTAGSIPFCASSRCVNAVCRPGFGNCDGIRTNGCEIDVDRSTEHCGRCDHPCEGALHALPTCELGACALVCEPGWTDCDASTPGCECGGT